jgi:leucine-rich repeat protein SHOC2
MNSQDMITKGKKSKERSLNLLDRISECDRVGQYELYLNNLILSKWPDETIVVNRIKILKAAKCQLKTIPSLEHFRCLIELDISRNFLSSLESIKLGLLVTIRVLDISRNSIECLPEDIIRMTSLEKLNCSHNFLITLPERTSEIRSLKVLDASYNNIKSIGNILEELNYLDELNLFQNENLEIEDMGLKARR